MRRKLFFIALGMAIIIFFLVETGVQVSDNPSIELYDRSSDYTGIVIDSQINKDKLSLTIKINNNGSKVLLNKYNEKADYSLIGKTIKFRTTLERAKERRNPHCFDYRMYLRSKDITAVSTINSFSIVEESGNLYYKYKSFFSNLKGKFIDSLSEDERGFVTGILFGDTSLLSEEVYDEFKANGTAHVLSVSGLHIGILYALVLKLLGKRQSFKSIIILFLIFFTYGTISLWSPSVTRAVGLIALKTIAEYTDRPFDFLSGIGLIAIVNMALNPYVIFNTGFQMSFLAAISIAFILPRMPKKIPDFVAITLAVTVGLTPYQIYVFNTLSLTSILGNIPVVYLVGAVMPFALLEFSLFAVFNLLGINLKIAILDIIVKSLSKVTVNVNSFTSLFGKGSLDIVSPGLGVIIFIILAFLFLASEQFEIWRIREKRRLILISLVGIIILSFIFSRLTYSPITDSDIVFVDVGQGDCINVNYKNKNVLIDGGGSASYNVGTNTLKPYLLKNKKGNVELALATHMHTDHFKGLEELREEGLIKSLKTNLTVGNSYMLGENVYIKTVWPLEIKGSQDENKNCSCFIISYKGYNIMITGDLDSEGEKEIINYYKSINKLSTLKCDILKVSHHGSKTSTSSEWLEAVNPKLAIIQVGKNTYGHPSQETLNRLKEKGIEILRNDLSGAIGLDFSKKGIEVNIMIKD